MSSSGTRRFPPSVWPNFLTSYRSFIKSAVLKTHVFVGKLEIVGALRLIKIVDLQRGLQLAVFFRILTYTSDYDNERVLVCEVW